MVFFFVSNITHVSAKPAQHLPKSATNHKYKNHKKIRYNNHHKISSYSQLLQTTIRAQQKAKQNLQHYYGIDCPTTIGVASYYANKFVGRLTTSGVPYYHSAYTAASNQLPLLSVVKVTNLINGYSVHVLITDRGAPHMKTIDLSRRSAEHLGFIHEGIAEVIIEYSPELTEEVMHNPNYHLVYNMDEHFVG